MIMTYWEFSVFDSARVETHSNFEIRAKRFIYIVKGVSSGKKMTLGQHT